MKIQSLTDLVILLMGMHIQYLLKWISHPPKHYKCMPSRDQIDELFFLSSLIHLGKLSICKLIVFEPLLSIWSLSNARFLI